MMRPAESGFEPLDDAFRAAYAEHIAPAVDALLGRVPGALGAWLLTPVRAAHARRRNFFRSAMLMESARAAGCSATAPLLGACAEIGWTCALVLDDIIDRSAEREGGPSTHHAYGLVRSLASVACTLLLIARALAAGAPSPWRTRLRRIRLGVTLVLRAARGAVADSPRSLRDFTDAARRVNSSVEWSLLAPYCDAAPGMLQAALRRYAAHSAVAGKMRNDMLDYLGGSSERDGRLEDFARAKATFPVLVLLSSALSPEDRTLVEAHFRRRRSIEPAQMYRMLESYSVWPRCLSLLADEIAAGDAALDVFAFPPEAAGLARLLRRWNRHMLESCRLRLTDHLAVGHS